MKRQRSVRRTSRTFIPGISTAMNVLESRNLTAPFFYRASPFRTTGSIQLNTQTSTDVDVFSGPQTFSVTLTNSQSSGDDQGSWSVSASESSTINDGGPGNPGGPAPGANGVGVTVQQSQQGTWNSSPGSFNDNQVGFQSDLSSGGDLIWALAMANPATPGGPPPFPPGTGVQTEFQATWAPTNFDNHGIPTLALVSSTLDVDVNTAGLPGLVITNPNDPNPGITLPPGYNPPPGRVVYFDASFGGNGPDQVDFVINEVVTPNNQGVYNLVLNYDSGLGPSSVTPNHPAYQDSFNWNVSYSP